MQLRQTFPFLLLLGSVGCGGPVDVAETPGKSTTTVSKQTSQADRRESRVSPAATPKATGTSTTPPAATRNPFSGPATTVSDLDMPEGPRKPYDDADPEGKLKPEALPELPKADSRSTHTALNKEKTLYLEKRPDDTKRIIFQAEVCLRKGMLEVFLTKQMTKEHEAILRTKIDARYLHAALEAIGAQKGKPVQFINPKTEEAEYKPASGQEIAVSVVYNLNGKRQEHAAQDWVLDMKTKKPMTQKWVFAGSRFAKNPDANPTDPEYYCANNGEIISISNFVDSMLDIPVPISKDMDSIQFEAITEKIPPVLSQVWVIMEPVKK